MVGMESSMLTLLPIQLPHILLKNVVSHRSVMANGVVHDSYFLMLANLEYVVPEANYAKLIIIGSV
jgi:hypothetical protein